MGAFSSVPAPDVKCPYCGAMNPANVLKCKNCAGSLAQRPSDQRDQPKSRPVTASSTKSSGIGKWIGLAVLGVVALFAFLLLRTTDTSASVQSVHWQRSIDVMAQQPVEHETWRDQLPSGAQLGPCTQKVRRTQDNPAPNADKVCGTPYTVDQGNGIGKVVQDCQYQVKDDWCKYTQQEWTVVDAQVAQGDDLKPYDPVPSLIPGQREGNHHETYEVVFSSDGKQYNYSPGDAAEFSRFAPGSRWTLKVNGLGGVVSAEGPK